MDSLENLSPATMNSLMKDIKELQKSPPEGITLILNEDNITDIQADITGPVDTPFEGGVFRMRLVLGQDFPQNPPKGYMLTKIFHPNIAKGGEICVNTLKKDWQPTVGLKHIFMVVRCLLIEPFPESALNEEAGKLLLEDYDSYAKHARLMTGIHARRGGEGKADGGGGEEGDAEASISKKAKAEKKKVVDKKRSLKRL